MFKYIIAILIVCLTVPNAMAGDQCYSNLQAEAEQGLRIHSELMVIGLNCQHMAKRYNMDLYGTYKEITERHSDLFELYEDALITFFEENGEVKPEKSLHKLRTNIANKISNDAANMRPDIFCGTYAPRIKKVSDMQRDDLREWASTTYEAHPISHPVCGG